MRRALPTLLILLPLLALEAQDIVVSEAHGSPILITTQGSEPLTEGSAIPPRARLSLGEESVVLLRRGTRSVELFRRGLYEVSELFNFRPLGRIDFRQLYNDRIKQFAGQEPELLIGGAAGGGDGPSLEEAISRLAGGSYDEAERLFREMIGENEAVSADGAHLLRILAAQAAYLQDRDAAAYRTLDEVEPEPGHRHYPLYLLLKAQLLIESHAFADALETLAEYLGDPADDEGALQTARLLTGVAYEGLGNLPVARTYYRRATSPDPTSTAAKVARRLLE